MGSSLDKLLKGTTSTTTKASEKNAVSSLLSKPKPQEQPQVVPLQTPSIGPTMQNAQVMQSTGTLKEGKRLFNIPFLTKKPVEDISTVSRAVRNAKTPELKAELNQQLQENIKSNAINNAISIALGGGPKATENRVLADTPKATIERPKVSTNTQPASEVKTATPQTTTADVKTPEKQVGPNEAKKIFKEENKKFKKDLEEFNLAKQQSRQAQIPGTESPTPVEPIPPKAPQFVNVQKPGTKPILLEEPGRPLSIAIREGHQSPSFNLYNDTLDRGIEASFPKEVQGVIKRHLSEPLRVAVTDMTRFTNGLRTELGNTFKKFNIKRGSIEDYAAADLVEGKVKKTDLVKQFGEDRAAQIEQAAEQGRVTYKQLLEKINESLTRNGYSPIPARENYVTHTQQIQTLVDRMGSLLNFDAKALPNEISGVNLVTKPGRKFFGFGQARMGGSTHEGLITALDKYINPAAEQIYLPSVIKNFRSLDKMISQVAPELSNLSNFKKFISDFADSLAGKTNILDRGVERIMGRWVMNAGNFLRSRVGANAVGANLSSALTNFIPWTQYLATIPKKFALAGLEDTVLSSAYIAKNPSVIDGLESSFLLRRFPREQIIQTTGQKVQSVMGSLFKAIDYFTARNVVAGKFYENVAKGMGKDAAMKAADDYAARVMADRSLGGMPLLYKSKIAGFATQFQLEVNNMVSFIAKDIPKNFGYSKAQIASALTQFSIYSYLFNETYQQVTGRRPQIDPIHFLVRLSQQIQEGRPIGEIVDPTKSNSAVGELAQNLPYVGALTGGRIPVGGAFPNLLDVATGKSTIGKELLKPVTGILTPTGGSQLKKTIMGIQNYRQGSVKDKNGKELYSIGKNKSNAVRSALFGSSATPEAINYYNNREAVNTGKAKDVVKEEDFGKTTIGKPEFRVDGKNVGLKPKYEKQYQQQVLEAYTKSLARASSAPGWKEKTNEEKKKSFDKIFNSEKTKIKDSWMKSDTIVEKIAGPSYAPRPESVYTTFAKYGKGIIVDPENTLKALFTEARLKKVTGSILKPGQGVSSLERKQFLSLLDKGDKNTQIDHKIALELGGRNEPSNYVVLSKEDNARKGRLENYLLKLVKQGKINKKKAQEYDLNWRESINKFSIK